MALIPIGVVGAGVMGRRAAETLAAAGHQVFVYDVAPGATAGLSAGLTPLPALADVASKTSIVLMYLPGPREVADCVAGPDGLLEHAQPGATIVDQSTVDPETSQHMWTLADAKSVAYLDAPVLGRPAMVGKWSLVVGGRAADVERCTSVLKVLAANVFHIGPAGSATR